ncbi:hypothetical protein BJ875DRAFT_440023 [Amylocarpus encephaloides]|uniref:Uncharacterized protein n=1 Tax=Amylocarpus encephaloides TaxID=45428 RepID=A0A9P7YLQ6_9HELO|nr:hypothetical protein BJ875DRAFT_440023 [Amylocarpus encephaloides]
MSSATDRGVIRRVFRREARARLKIPARYGAMARLNASRFEEWRRRVERFATSPWEIQPSLRPSRRPLATTGAGDVCAASDSRWWLQCERRVTDELPVAGVEIVEDVADLPSLVVVEIIVGAMGGDLLYVLVESTLSVI